MSEYLEFTSRSPFEIHHILTDLENTPQITIGAELFFPDGEGPFSCVVAHHGSKGWAAHHQDHIECWISAGLAVCKVNSFSSRGIDSTVDDQLSVTHAMMLVDAFSAYSALSQDTRIRKIGIAGWSLGGTVALYSAWKPIIDVFGSSFDAHLPFYPAAHIRPEIQDWSESPIFILHGEIDDWTPIHLVDQLINQIPNVTLRRYPDAHHGFDSKDELTYLPNAVRLRKRTVKINKKGKMSGELFPGIILPLNERWQRRWIIRILRNRGAHVQGNLSAREDALVSGTEFLVSNLVNQLHSSE